MIRWNRLVNMAVAHIRRHGNTDSIEIVFRYNNPQIGIDRVFNFQRSITETIQATLQRIKTNVGKEYDKKLKKKPKKSKNAAASSSDATPPPPEPIMPPREVDLSGGQNDKNESTTWSDLLANIDQHEFNGSKLNVFGQEYTIAYNYPYVSQITMPTVILVGFNCYPSKFDVEFTERNECQFEWYRGHPTQTKNDADIEWNKCEQEEFFYQVQTTDLQHKLKVKLKKIIFSKTKKKKKKDSLKKNEKNLLSAGLPSKVRHKSGYDRRNSIELPRRSWSRL